MDKERKKSVLYRCILVLVWIGMLRRTRNCVKVLQGIRCQGAPCPALACLHNISPFFLSSLANGSLLWSAVDGLLRAYQRCVPARNPKPAGIWINLLFVCAQCLARCDVILKLTADPLLA